MKAIVALLLTIVFTVGIWTTLVPRPPVPFVSPPSGKDRDAHSDQEDTREVQWITGIVRHIDPLMGTVLLQIAKGMMELFASPQVLGGLTEGEIVSVYVAA
jgi:hypothetical protein